MKDLVWRLLRAARAPQLVNWVQARHAHETCLARVRAGADVRFGPTARVLDPRGSSIAVGARTSIDGELLVHDYGGRIAIGEACYVGVGSRLWSGDDLRIGDHVFIAHNVTITDTNAHQVDAGERAAHYQRTVVDGRPFEKGTIETAPVRIGDHAWINFNVAVLKGVTIGEGAIIGAGSVVTKDVPAYVLCAGNPARVIRRLEEHEHARR
jgi:acetyltransferase-like isoleucine patch superfamily enzyme